VTKQLAFPLDDSAVPPSEHTVVLRDHRRINENGGAAPPRSS
jgi:hypothetical protein